MTEIDQKRKIAAELIHNFADQLLKSSMSVRAFWNKFFPKLQRKIERDNIIEPKKVVACRKWLDVFCKTYKEQNGCYPDLSLIESEARAKGYSKYFVDKAICGLPYIEIVKRVYGIRFKEIKPKRNRNTEVKGKPGKPRKVQNEKVE